MADKTLFETETYEVVQVDDALSEDNKTRLPGYGVRNKNTGVMEHTTTILPGAIWQCKYFTNALEDLMEEPKEGIVEVGPAEDVVIN